MPPTVANGLRLANSQSNDRLLSSQPEDVPVQSLFTMDAWTSEPRTAEPFRHDSNTPPCVAENYRAHFYDYVSNMKRQKKKGNVFFVISLT